MNAEEQLLAMYRGMTIKQLLERAGQSQKYQQHIVVQAFSRKRPVEDYIRALISSQAALVQVYDIIIEKYQEEAKNDSRQR